MIDKDTMLKLAEKHVVNAPNSDWRGRGKLTLEGDLLERVVKTWDGKELGNSTAGFFKFEHPFKDDFFKDYFTGFILTAMKVGNKFISETHPVIGKLEDNDYGCSLANHFCPQCHSVDSITSKSRMIGPECARITYKCKKCSYRDVDVID